MIGPHLSEDQPDPVIGQSICQSVIGRHLIEDDPDLVIGQSICQLMISPYLSEDHPDPGPVHLPPPLTATRAAKVHRNTVMLPQYQVTLVTQ